MVQTAEQQAMLALLDETPLRPKHYWLWLLSTGGTMLGGFSVFTLGVALPLLAHTFTIGPGLEGMIGAALLVGAIPGSAVGGPLSDRFGRKTLMLFDMALIALGAFLAAFSNGPAMLLVNQFVIGLGIGIDYPVASAYVAEWMPKSARSRMMVATIAFQGLGFLLAGAFTATVLYLSGAQNAWRGFMLVEAVLPLVILALRLSLRESARWYMSKGRNAEAASAISYVLGSHGARLSALAAAAGQSPHLVANVPWHVTSVSFGTLFTQSYWRRTILATVPWFLMDIAAYGIGLFTPVILGALYFGGRANGPVTADFSDIEGTAGLDLFLLFGFLLGLWAVPRFGRLRMQITGFGGMVAGMLLLLFALLASAAATPNLVAVFGGFIVFNLAMNIGPASVTFGMPAELFPTQLRGTGSGFASAAAKTGAALGVFVVPILKGSIGLPAVLVLMAIVSVLGGLVTALFAEEIEDQGSLEDRHRPGKSDGA